MAFFNPFCSEEAISHSNYCTLQQKDYTTSEPIKGRKKQATEKVVEKLSTFVAELKKPRQQLGLSSGRKRCSFGVYPELGSLKATAGLCRDLVHFLDDLKQGKGVNTTYMAVFISSARLTEQEFQVKVEEQMALLEKATEPFFCTPESLEPALLQDPQLLLFGGKILRVVSIYRNTSQGQLKFDYPMLAFQVQDTNVSAPEAKASQESSQAQGIIDQMSKRYSAERAKA